MDEFAMGSSTENSAFQPTTNPWDASATSRRIQRRRGRLRRGRLGAPFDRHRHRRLDPATGRPLRYVSGHEADLRPRQPLRLVAFASSLDQAGPLSRTVEDSALLLQAIAGHDPRDSTSADRPVPAFYDSARSVAERD